MAHWLYFHDYLNFCLRHWAKLQPRKNRKGVEKFLGLLDLERGELTPKLSLGPKSGRVTLELIAASLADGLKVQLGMAVSDDVLPRKCLECPNWFQVTPGRDARRSSTVRPRVRCEAGDGRQRLRKPLSAQILNPAN